jgi:hypothetical protein
VGAAASRSYCAKRTGLPKPSRFSGGHWRSMRRGMAPTIPMSRPASVTARLPCRLNLVRLAVGLALALLRHTLFLCTTTKGVLQVWFLGEVLKPRVSARASFFDSIHTGRAAQQATQSLREIVVSKCRAANPCGTRRPHQALRSILANTVKRCRDVVQGRKFSCPSSKNESSETRSGGENR